MTENLFPDYVIIGRDSNADICVSDITLIETGLRKI
jgi:hypothetical protein